MLLPIGRAEERARVTSIIVYALIIANILVFLMELAGGDRFIYGYAVGALGNHAWRRPRAPCFHAGRRNNSAEAFWLD